MLLLVKSRQRFQSRNLGFVIRESRINFLIPRTKNFIPEFIKKCIFCCILNHKIRDTYDHIAIVLALCTTLLSIFFTKLYIFLNSNPGLLVLILSTSRRQRHEVLSLQWNQYLVFHRGPQDWESRSQNIRPLIFKGRTKYTDDGHSLREDIFHHEAEQRLIKAGPWKKFTFFLVMS